MKQETKELIERLEAKRLEYDGLDDTDSLQQGYIDGVIDMVRELGLTTLPLPVDIAIFGRN